MTLLIGYSRHKRFIFLMKWLFFRNHNWFLSPIIFVVLVNLMAGAAVRAQDLSPEWRPMGEAQKLARLNGEKVLVFAERQPNIYCKKMKQNVFSSHSVIDSINHYFYAVKLNISSTLPMIFNGKEMTPKKFARRNHIKAMPSIIFLDSVGSKIAVQPGFISAPKFRSLLGFIGSGAYKKMDFNTYLKRFGGTSDKKK